MNFQVLGNEQFHLLAHHVVIGNQIIIRCDDKAMVKSFIEALKVSHIDSTDYYFKT